jgi:hypothetical protein
MVRRLPSTLADYVVVGLNPALIMILIASVIFFLVDVFFPCHCACTDFSCNARLKFVFAMYIMGTVAVGRISMEEGAGYASLFAGPLALAAFVAINAFVRMEGNFAAMSPFINLGLMALIWWLAYQLTWDCTVIDERADTSDQGLLQAFGGDDTLAEETPPVANPAAKPLAQAILENPWPWLQQLWERSKQPHAHGVWILYFALGALPIFGFGGWFTRSRQTAFAMLVLYVASSLALLLSTSFLGLRRYLRRRQLEMPVEMTSVWLAVGGIMIVGVLLACVILPRPGAEVAISQIPLPTFSSPWQTPSKFGNGSDGKQPGQNPGGSQGTQTKRNSESQPSTPNSQSQQAQQDPNAPNQASQTNGSNDKQSQTNTPAQSNNQDEGKSNPSEQSAQQGQSQQGQKQSQQNQSQPSQASANQNQQGKSGSNQQNSEQNKQPNSQSSSTNSPNRSQSVLKNKPSNEANRSPQPNASQQSQTQQDSASNSPSSFSPTKLLSSFFGMLGVLLKLIFYAALFGAIAYYVYQYRAELLAAWQKLLAELRALWERWFGKHPSQTVQAEPAVVLPPPKTFADFADPFLTGAANSLSPLDLLRYTFAALQAWGRDQGCPRQENETPHEYVERLENLAPHLAEAAKRVVDYYALAAYARGRLPPQSVEAARALWQQFAASPGLVSA